METFVQLSCLLACQQGQCFSYEMRRETFIYGNRKTSKHDLAPTNVHSQTYKHKHKCTARLNPDYVVSRVCSYDTISDEFIHVLISCWQVTESLLSLNYEEFRIYILASDKGNSRDCSSSVDAVTVKK